MNSPELCPFCHNTSVAPGRYFLWDAYGGPGFEPGEIQISKLKKAVTNTCATIEETAKACVHCGKVWGEIDLDELRRLLRKHGSDDCKTRLSFDLNR